MPPSSRKRNKGKERKAKQQAKKEEYDRADAHRCWQSFYSSIGCDHGHEMVTLADNHPISSFMDQYYINFHHKDMTVSQNLTNLFETYQHIFNNESYRKLLLDVLVHIGTNMTLGFHSVDIANTLCVAQSIVALEHYSTGCIHSVINSLVVRSKWRDLTIKVSSGRRDALKFYRKRTTCKCLKKMHLEARKTIPKLGNCHHCEEEMDRELLHVCSRCMLGQFCSRECQVAHWPTHERDCDIFVSARKRDGSGDDSTLG